jgi:hypothetical protein
MIINTTTTIILILRKALHAQNNGRTTRLKSCEERLPVLEINTQQDKRFASPPETHDPVQDKFSHPRLSSAVLNIVSEEQALHMLLTCSYFVSSGQVTHSIAQTSSLLESQLSCAEV